MSLPWWEYFDCCFGSWKIQFSGQTYYKAKHIIINANLSFLFCLNTVGGGKGAYMELFETETSFGRTQFIQATSVCDKRGTRISIRWISRWLNRYGTWNGTIRSCTICCSLWSFWVVLSGNFPSNSIQISILVWFFLLFFTRAAKRK